MNIQTILDLDLHLFQSLSSLVPQKYQAVLHISAELIVFFVGFFLISLWIYGVISRKDAYKISALQIFFTILLVFVVYTIINIFLPQWRPGAMEISGAHAMIPHPIDNSFPSGHALFSIAFIMGLFRYFARSWAIVTAILLAAITLFARVAGGVHYPGDIIGGLLIGACIVTISSSVVKNITRLTSPYLFRFARIFHL